jgi:hypothetical protein
MERRRSKVKLMAGKGDPGWVIGTGARDLSQTFEIVFRGLAQSDDGFSRETLEPLQRRLMSLAATKTPAQPII